MKPTCALAAWLIACVVLPVSLLAQDPFLENVRTTEPLSGAEEQKTFQLPEGFEIQLVAEEPQIQKPLNMAFDAAGRLWLTDTVEYPYAAPVDRPGRDSIKVLSQFGPDGRAGKVETFAEGLNIPIGVYPYRDGAIAYSIPHIYRFFDEDGDGKSEQRERLYGPFGYDRDTHGMNNAFRRGFDGWLYACHGFNNLSQVAGADGHSITMASGNTYRMRLDGVRIEHFTHGQVNPFGMAIDPLGNLFTADCHSKPIYALLRDGQYPGFGRPHDGLGFVEPIMQHLHDSTAIAGVAVYAAEQFPPEYRGNLFTGNVMTSRVNRDSLEYRGSTIVARQEPDFLSTSDPWFRPVDIQLGPDGALYIADFYNRIIGHYEVALDHPGRDRHRGRIWRVVYRGQSQQPAPIADLSKRSAEELVAALDDPNLTVRLLATDQLVDRLGASASETAEKAFTVATARQRAHLMWVLHRLERLAPETLLSAMSDPDDLVRIHALKCLAESPRWSESLQQAAIERLADENAFVRRAAAEALGQQPAIDNVAPLITLIEATDSEDSHLRYVAMRSLVNQLRQPEMFVQATGQLSGEAAQKLFAKAAIAIPTAEAAAYLLDHLESGQSPPEEIVEQVRQIARRLPAEHSGRLASLAQRRFADQVDLQIELLAAAVGGLKQQGAAPGKEFRAWGVELAQGAFSQPSEGGPWIHSPLTGKPRLENPWVLQQRSSADGDSRSWFLTSLPRGEQLTGVLRSPEFAAPDRLSFYIAGHIGPPGQPVSARNFVRLRRAGSNDLIAETTPPRNDVAQKVEWDLAAHRGQRCYLEIVDGDERGAYAWLAVGRFEPEVAPLPEVAPAVAAERKQAAALLAAEWKLAEMAPQLTASLTDAASEPALEAACALAIGRIRDDGLSAALAPLLAEAELTGALREQIAQAIAGGDRASVEEAVSLAMRSVSRRLQESLAQSLAVDRSGGELLLALAYSGKASPRLLAQPAVRERLVASRLENVENRIAAITAHLPSEDEATKTLIEARRQAFLAADKAIDRGAAVFTKNCAICHQLKGQGPLIGPQLDGIGNRGLGRLLEDMLDPNRNVDAAFRTTALRTVDGRVLNGLVRNEEGEAIVLVDEKGKEFTVAKDDVEERALSSLSLMPQNVAQTMPEGEFHDLLAFLLSQTSGGK